MSRPLVTISSAFHNTGDAIVNMIKSVFAQTFTDWELLLIDDGSTDHTLSLVQSIDDSRIRIYQNDGNRGRSYSLNRITELAGGKYIARMDSDDLCSPKRIEKQVSMLEKDDRLDAVSTGVIYLDKDGHPLGDMVCPTADATICATPWRTFQLVHGALMAKKDFFKNTPYREDIPFAIDFNLFLRSYQTSRFGNVPEPLYYYCLDSSFNLKKQFTARKYSASFLFDHYARRSGPVVALRHAASQYIKFAATLYLFVSGQRKWLMAKRYEPLTQEKLSFYYDEITLIKGTRLPMKSDRL